MSTKTPFEIAVEMSKALESSPTRQKRLKSSTFWNEFQVKSRHHKTVRRIARLLAEQNVDVAVKSGKPLGKEDRDEDWIILTLRDHAALPGDEPDEPDVTVFWPSPQWFEHLADRQFETEREVEAYFVGPLLDALGYSYEDICIGCPIEMLDGMTRIKREVDFVVFDGPSRKQKDVLLLVEARSSEEGISSDAIEQARVYARQLIPACYLVTNGRQIVVFRFSPAPERDERVMFLDRSELKQRWKELYGYASRQAAIERKKRMRRW